MNHNTGQTSNAAKVLVTVAPRDTIVTNPAAATTQVGVPVTLDVLANDTIDGEPAEGMAGVTLAITSPTYYGTATVTGNNQILYTPYAGNDYAGAESFTYSVTDAAGTTVSGTASVRIAAVDQFSAETLNVETTENTEVSSSLPGNWAYVEVITPPSHGRLVNYTDGSFEYMPDRNFKGADAFQYTAYDHSNSLVP